MKSFLTILSLACAVCAANFAASGEIQGNTENIANIARWQRTNRRMAIFDAGGFSAADSAKNAEVCSLMQTVNYSAIAVGDEELRFSEDFWDEMNKKFSLPLLATNIKVKSGKKLFEKIRVVEYNRSGEKYAVVSILGNEEINEISDDYEIEDPRTMLSLALAQIPQDYIIVLLAHCDPMLTDSLISENPRIDFGVQGHRKTVMEPVRLHSGKQVLQFGPNGERIAILNRKGIVRWRIFPQRQVAQRTNPTIKIDIFAMSGCPYSKTAIKDFLPLMSDRNYAITIYFAGTYDPQTHNLSPGMPNGDIEEEKNYLAVQNLYPEKFQDFLFCAVSQDCDMKKTARIIGLDSAKIAKWNAEKGGKILAENYKKSQIYNITECPTIMINNKITNISPRNLIRNLCKFTRDTLCFNFGECDIDDECPNSKDGIGVCVENAKKCSTIKDTAKITLITSKYETPNLPVDYVLQSTLGLVWKLEIDTLDFEDFSAKKMLEKFNIERIPAIIFDKSAQNLYNFPRLSQKLIETPDGFVLDWGEIPDGFYYKRDFRKKELVVVADSITAEEIKPFIEENSDKWYLLKDDETDGWLIWWENRCLTSGQNEREAKILIDYYKKIGQKQ